jgi:hypothetical protein
MKALFLALFLALNVPVAPTPTPVSRFWFPVVLVEHVEQIGITGIVMVPDGGGWMLADNTARFYVYAEGLPNEMAAVWYGLTGSDGRRTLWIPAGTVIRLRTLPTTRDAWQCVGVCTIEPITVTKAAEYTFCWTQ